MTDDLTAPLTPDQLRRQLALRSGWKRATAVLALILAVVAGAAAGRAAGYGHPLLVEHTRIVTRTVPKLITRTVYRTKTVTGAASFRGGAGAIGCWQAPGLDGDVPSMSIDRTVPADTTWTTCTIEAQTPTVANQWPITAPNGKQSIATDALLTLLCPANRCGRACPTGCVSDVA